MGGEQLGLGVLGAVIGLASGALAVLLERTENLEHEDLEDYELDVAEAREAAEKTGTEPLEPPPPEFDTYGWTWLEWGLSPALGAAAFAWFASAAHDNRLLAIDLIWLAIFVHVTAFDIKHRLILNQVTFPAIGLALIASVFTPNLGLAQAVAGSVAIWGVFMAQNLALGSRVIGRGDAKLGAIVGAVTGLWFSPLALGAVWAVVIAFMLGGGGAVLLLLGWSVRATLGARRPVDVPRLFFRQLRLSLKEPIPYGPFICAGAVLVLMTNLG